MENKRKYLFITVIALFIVSFYTINLRFDPFYRVNGINNDNMMISIFHIINIMNY